jgi:hypothetical protein
MVLDILKEKEEAKIAPTDQIIDRLKGTGRSVQLAVTFRDLALTNQKLNAIIVKRNVIMLEITGIQLRGLKRIQIL